MLTLQQTLRDQDDLELLCADRPLRTAEVFRPNAFYGIDLVLKRYARLPRTYALKAVVPHGVVLDRNLVWKKEAKALVPAVLCYPNYRQRAYAAKTDKKVVPSASPFLYVVQMLQRQAQPARKGTIFFPHHSTHHVTVAMDFERLAEELALLGEEYRPLAVCVYWRDFNLGHHKAFTNRGMRLVSAGHMFDPGFLFRLFHLCSSHRYAAGNGFGSHTFYSLKAGCSYFHLDRGRPVRREDGTDHGTTAVAPSKEDSLRTLFAQPRPTPSAAQLQTADMYLGADHMRSPAELRRLLLDAELIDKMGFVLRDAPGRSRLKMPCFFRRLNRELRGRARAARNGMTRRIH